MSTESMLWLYLATAAVAGGVTGRHAARARPRRGEHLGAQERIVLVVAGALAGALWLPLGLVLVRGWTRRRLPVHLAALRRRWGGGAHDHDGAPGPGPATVPDATPQPGCVAAPHPVLMVPSSALDQIGAASQVQFPALPLARVTAHSLWPAGHSSAA